MIPVLPMQNVLNMLQAFVAIIQHFRPVAKTLVASFFWANFLGAYTWNIKSQSCKKKNATPNLFLSSFQARQVLLIH